MLQDEWNYLRGQLHGLEAIFLELAPFHVPLRRQEIQDFYDSHFTLAMKPTSATSQNELRRRFNLKANHVQHIVDGAESLGDPQDKLNLIYAACSLPSERLIAINSDVEKFCRLLLGKSEIDEGLLANIWRAKQIRPNEARLLLASTMFLITEYIEGKSGQVPLYRLLERLIELFDQKGYLSKQDPFMIEARCLAEAMQG
jgi:hypothetical protein